MLNKTLLTKSVLLFALSFSTHVEKASAVTIDPFAFCSNSCKKPGGCDDAKVQAQCQKTCSPDHIWKHAASLEMSKNSKEYRTEKDKQKKEDMLYTSSTAKCLALTPPKKEEVSTSPAGHNAVKGNAACEAAKTELENRLKEAQVILNRK